MTGNEKPFWRSEPLSDDERALWDEVARAHAACVFRNNASSHVLIQASIASCDYTKGLAAALMSLGGMHGPIEQAMGILTGGGPEAANRYISFGLKVPGWGNSFVKGAHDPLWVRVDEILFEKFSRIHELISATTAMLHKLGKKVFPNPSIYTAALAVALELPAPLAVWLFIKARLDGWTELVWKSSYGGAV